MFGARGAGKSLTMGATLHHADGNNLIIQDPPRQLWNRFREPLEAKGYRVVKIDQDDPASGLGYNPVAHLADSTPLSWDRDVRDIANLIVADIDTAGKAGSHFRDMGAVFIKGILGWLYQHDQQNATPYGVASLLLLKSDDQREQAFKSMLATGGQPAPRRQRLAVGGHERGRQLQEHADERARCLDLARLPGAHGPR